MTCFFYQIDVFSIINIYKIVAYSMLRILQSKNIIVNSYDFPFKCLAKDTNAVKSTIKTENIL